MFSVREIDKYLARIDYDGGVTPSLQNLQRLVIKHLMGIPFETIRLHRTGQVPDLTPEALYQTMIIEGKGGYCFELNKLFFLLLSSLQYKVRPVLARSIDTPGQTDPINHRASIVAIEGESYLVDVGWGGPAPAGPLLLKDIGTQEIGGKSFIASPVAYGQRKGRSVRPEQDSLQPPVQWKIERIPSSSPDSQPVGIMVVYMIDAFEPDFDMLNCYLSRPGSEFRDTELANLTRKNGHVSLTETTLTIMENNEKKVLQLDSSEVDDALAKYFRLDYSSLRS